MIRIPAADGEVLIWSWFGEHRPGIVWSWSNKGLLEVRTGKGSAAKLRASKRKLRGKTLMERAEP